MNAVDFYHANATNIVNVPRVNHPEDPSGIAGVRRALAARFYADDAPVMSVSDACQFAEAYAAAQRDELKKIDDINLLDNHDEIRKLRAALSQAQQALRRVKEAVHNIYYAAVWHADRSVDEQRLWTELRDAAGFPAGRSPKEIPNQVSAEEVCLGCLTSTHPHRKGCTNGE